MSKKQPFELWTLVQLTLIGALLCFPRGLLVMPGQSWIQAPICAGLALCLSNLLLRIGPVPAFLRAPLLLPIALPPLFALILRPDPLVVVAVLLPFALVLNRQTRWGGSRPAGVRAAAVFLVLTVGATGLTLLSGQLPASALPRLPHHTFFYILVDLVLILGIASRQSLRPFALALLRWQVVAFLVLLYLIPVGFTFITSLKASGEPARHFLDPTPRPRFTIPGPVSVDSLIPETFADLSDAEAALRALEFMNRHLSEPGVEAAFGDDAPLPPGEMVRALKLYGYVLRDIHGNFVPERAFTRDPPSEISPAYLPWIHRALEHLSFTPREIADHLSISPREAGILLRKLQRLNLTGRIPGPEPRFRLTSQARHPLDNGLYPRQILLILRHRDAGRPIQINVRDYGAFRKLEYQRKLAELNALVEAGALRLDPGPHFDAYTELLENERLWRNCGLFVLCALLALLAGRCLPTELPQPSGILLTSAGLILLAPLPMPPFLQMCLATGWGLWLLRVVSRPDATLCTRVTLFASASLIPNLLPLAMPEGAPLVRQAAWACLWIPPALILLFFAVRPLPENGSVRVPAD